MKTNKSYTKRLKLTKNGKMVARKSGKNHYNAKRSGAKTLDGKRTRNITITNKSKAKFLPGLIK